MRLFKLQIKWFVKTKIRCHINKKKLMLFQCSTETFLGLCTRYYVETILITYYFFPPLVSFYLYFQNNFWLIMTFCRKQLILLYNSRWTLSMYHIFNDILFLVHLHTHATPTFMTCCCISMFLHQPSILWVCGSAQRCVCVPWSLSLHMAGTWYNSLDSQFSLSFNSVDGGEFCSQHFSSLTKVHIKLHWTLLRKYIYHWVPILKNRGFPEMETPIL